MEQVHSLAARIRRPCVCVCMFVRVWQGWTTFLPSSSLQQQACFLHGAQSQALG
jgi:hypothetical protein